MSGRQRLLAQVDHRQVAVAALEQSVDQSARPATDLAIAITAAQSAYDDGQAALARGDFAAYGEAQDRLKAALDAIAAAEAELSGDQLLPETPTVTDETQPEGTAA